MLISDFWSNLRKDSIEKNPEVMPNRSAFRCMNITMLMITAIWLLNVLNIFIIDKGVTNIAFVLCVAVYIVGMLVCAINGSGKRWIKYFVLAWAVVIVTILHIFLTYHAVITLMVPIVLASMYSSKRTLIYTYCLTVVSIVVSVYVGYYVGLCDANMVLLTAEPLTKYIAENNTFLLTQINSQVPYTLGLFFVLPRVIASGFFAFVCNSVSKIIGQTMKRAQAMEVLAEIDGMTGMYNKTKYLEMIEGAYLEEEWIAVIFWDINNLKKINDSMGHEKGDLLIKTVAESIQKLCTSNSQAYRIGGDEFVLIISGGRERIIQRKLNEWQIALNQVSKTVDIEMSVSYGYAYGKGEELLDIINAADHMMYENKREFHNQTDEK